ncbi:MAG: DUF2835 family protein [Gammaproteobacteria bacterium]|nr:DUF2835 family protein [Gammaproteobacteria bacterium]
MDISSQQYLSYYKGSSKFVNVQTDYGRSLKFPASELQKFVTRSGIQGRFEIEFHEQYKLVSLSRL